MYILTKNQYQRNHVIRRKVLIMQGDPEKIAAQALDMYLNNLRYTSHLK